jgi:hypothetical protein
VSFGIAAFGKFHRSLNIEHTGRRISMTPERMTPERMTPEHMIPEQMCPAKILFPAAKCFSI